MSLPSLRLQLINSGSLILAYKKVGVCVCVHTVFCPTPTPAAPHPYSDVISQSSVEIRENPKLVSGSHTKQAPSASNSTGKLVSVCLGIRRVGVWGTLPCNSLGKHNYLITGLISTVNSFKPLVIFTFRDNRKQFLCPEIGQLQRLCTMALHTSLIKLCIILLSRVSDAISHCYTTYSGFVYYININGYKGE